MAPRAIRVGVLLRDQLVEEHVFVDTAPITLGSSLRCRLSVPADGMPTAHVLFVRERERLLLHPPPGMSGRISQGGAVVELGEPGGPIAIERDARGKLLLGEATILFQEVPVPARVPRPRLPASLRGSLSE